MRASRNGRRRSTGPIEGIMFDLDGTLVLTDISLGSYRVLPGAIEVLAKLNARGIHGDMHGTGLGCAIKPNRAVRPREFSAPRRNSLNVRRRKAGVRVIWINCVMHLAGPRESATETHHENEVQQTIPK